MFIAGFGLMVITSHNQAITPEFFQLWYLLIIVPVIWATRRQHSEL